MVDVSKTGYVAGLLSNGGLTIFRLHALRGIRHASINRKNMF